jgi:hypothetical protein
MYWMDRPSVVKEEKILTTQCYHDLNCTNKVEPGTHTCALHALAFRIRKQAMCTKKRRAFMASIQAQIAQRMGRAA